MKTLSKHALWLTASLWLAASACSKAASHSESAQVGASASAPPAAVPAPAPSAANAGATWFAGTWTATLKAERYGIEMTRAEGAVAEWAKDDGKVGVGPASLQLQVTPDGSVSGASDGALGKLVATGQTSGENLVARVSSSVTDASKAFSGTLLATRAGDTLKGTLQVSTGDSLLVRQAQFVLTKLGTAPAL